MKDLRKLTLDQANKIEMALIMLEDDVKSKIECFNSLVEDEMFTEQTRATMKSNAEWWQEVYNILYKEN